MYNYRQENRNLSNNPQNPNKNICVLAVAHGFQVEAETRYLHTFPDLKRALRAKYSVRSALTIAGKHGVTVGQARRNLVKNQKNGYIIGYVVGVKGHVLALNARGETIIDTAPRKKDSRQVTELYGIYVNEKTVKAFG